MRTFLYTVNRVGLPLQWFVTIPEHVADAIQGGDDAAAINLARAITATYEPTDDPKQFWKTLDGHQFLIRFESGDQSLDEIIKNFMLHGVYEPKTTALVKELVKPGMRTIDVGASIGYFTLLLARQVGSTGSVISIEPTANQFPLLRANVEKNGYADIVATHNIAASNVNGVVHIQCNATNPKEVNGRRLESFIDGPIDFIKIDTDGSDLRALQGLQGVIEQSPDLIMACEFYPKYLKALGSSPAEFTAFVDRYFTHEIIEGDYEGECENWICTRKRK